jgi:hypothetical protein
LPRAAIDAGSARGDRPENESTAMRVRYYEGRHIYLRPVELADEAPLRRWVNDPAN